jgi:membrane-associated phospholipid phosphatase
MGDQEQRFYIKVIPFVYFIWILAFVTVGSYASTLPMRDLTTILDRQMPFIPEFIWIYVSCYVLPLLSFVVLTDWHRFNRLLLSFIIANLSSFVIYITFPINFQRPELGQSLVERLLLILYRADFFSASNNFPSMHIIFSWLFYFMCRGQRLGKVGTSLVLFLVVMITISAVLIKMHLVTDAISGILWALATWALAKYLYPRLTNSQNMASAAFKEMIRGIVPVFLLFGVLFFFVVVFRLLPIF